MTKLVEGEYYEVTFIKYDECGSETIVTMDLPYTEFGFNHPSGKDGTYTLIAIG